jgi:hypothetical protein
VWLGYWHGEDVLTWYSYLISNMDVCWISEYLQDDVVSNCIIQFAHCEAWYVALCNLQGINGGLLLSCQELFCLATLAFIVNCFS